MRRQETILFNMSLFVLGYIIFLLKGKLLYNEELKLMAVYILLFSIFVLVSHNPVKNFLIQQTLNLMNFSEKVYYLKIKILVISLIICENLNNKVFIKNNKYLINWYIKLQRKIYLNNRTKYYNPLFLCYILVLLNMS